MPTVSLGSHMTVGIQVSTILGQFLLRVEFRLWQELDLCSYPGPTIYKLSDLRQVI